ncbi:MAG: DNA-protecting protein DprA [Planctomycetaceae bacterium]|jgi:DNA processing protein|nr:DNA-protecting protein DprA [Planctomycetaceae bacterium]
MNQRMLLDFLQLTFCKGIGPLTFQNLLNHFSNATEILKAPTSALQQVPRIGRKTIQAIYDSQTIRAKMQSQLKLCQSHNIEIVPCTSQRYPAPLKHIPAPPPVIFCQGNLALLQHEWPTQTTIAIVGTRQATQYGLRLAHTLTRDLTVDAWRTVSGLARGIDRTVHQATLDHHGTTIAVLGSGLLRIYPSEHQGLAQTIRQHGLLISEVLPSDSPHSRLFPRRNRIISGLSAGVIVVEAAIRSGALITARHALEQNREVMAVPGMVDIPVAAGCNQLIKDGAQLIEDATDVYTTLEHTLTCAPNSLSEPVALPPLSDLEQRVYELIPGEPTYIDLLPTDAQHTMPQLLATITSLELKNLVRRPTGNSVQRIR